MGKIDIVSWGARVRRIHKKVAENTPDGRRLGIGISRAVVKNLGWDRSGLTTDVLEIIRGKGKPSMSVLVIYEIDDIADKRLWSTCMLRTKY